MPSTIVSSVMKKLGIDLDSMPAITITFDGQGDPTLDTRLEAFVDQDKAFHNRRTKKMGTLQPSHHA
jgi:wyosine [tRNA(Phe)-imidazoG37] synthetase (radical SAM superfamily)